MDFFDESIFGDLNFFKKNDMVAVNNKADEFLIKKHGKMTTSPCDVRSNVTINPLLPCFGVNLYTLDARGKNVLNSLKFNKIYVSEKPSNHILNIEDYNKPDDDNCIFGYNKQLTSLESAIMVKYFAKFSNINISIKLYIYIKNHFKDGKLWFIIPDLGIIQDEKHELYENNILLDIFKLNITDEFIHF